MVVSRVWHRLRPTSLERTPGVAVPYSRSEPTSDTINSPLTPEGVLPTVPRIVRPMRVEPDGLPRIGNRSKCLGVREPPDGHADVDVDVSGCVILNRKGLSVSEDWRSLPGHLIPNHLDDGFNGASGRGMRVFVHGSGDFSEGSVASGLELQHKVRTSTAGVIAPSALVLLAQYQQDLVATRPHWVDDES